MGIAVLLGAGASVKAGIPTATGLTATIAERIAKIGESRALNLALSYIIRKHHLYNRQIPDIELVFSTARSLAERHKSDLHPFIYSWDRDVSLLEDLYVYGGGRKGLAFRELPDYITILLRDTIWLRPDCDVSCLGPLLELPENPLVIYSLNYDNTIELLCRDRGEANDGMTEDGEINFDPSARVHLIKLHGSGSWFETPRGNMEANPLSTTYTYKATDEEVQDAYRKRASMILGRGNKLTAKGPYLDLLRRFHDDLEQRTVLLVVGYSFRDDHINHYLAQWFDRRPDRRIVILNGSNFATGKERSSFADHLMDRGNEWAKRVVAIPAYADAESLASAVKQAIDWS